jgi:hypothetical protein
MTLVMGNVPLGQSLTGKGQSVTEKDLSISAFSSHYNSTNAPNSSIHFSPTLQNLCN